MNARTRREAIRDLLRNRPVGVDELAVRFNVTASTIRRDLAVLTEAGEIVRTYGGALAPGCEEQPLHERETLAGVEKAAIAREAEKHVRQGQLLFLDAGTTVGALAARLAGWTGISVATTGLTTLNALADAEGVELIALGGVVRHISQGTVGPLTELALTRLTADAVFFSGDGITAERGVCEASAEQAAAKRRLIEQASEVFVLADASKLGRASSHWWTTLPPAWTLITDSSATEEQLAPFRALPGVTVHVAQV
ncbi:DeoR/GlpR family DNA-binding transcription regulator [Amycolatopsis acidiphila]|uniref:DeoR/GlpR transcriptional regulator n=1 Tax=Amycolatopsis acidiphila TaxID=715473 RepID=A0A558AFG4_9PSEU|nr:DeoR/GlpR family DNA-binding transcription regulator [Amycolatopsis acidiphila]TVT22999.1 DeoR/GlpR transcriptional regulator [Amycolatopsis acidiphila]UIJ57166.1 DeoR/GlpR family DNA-binding transcription regulator [Amycolatopsis acidiphila]GHG52944.1 DeoR family transcriptional regulator [Amycolatopsis acidiphila]